MWGWLVKDGFSDTTGSGRDENVSSPPEDVSRIMFFAGWMPCFNV
jgi:hypothetical protein